MRSDQWNKAGGKRQMERKGNRMEEERKDREVSVGKGICEGKEES
jgi:hypothetical protein